MGSEKIRKFRYEYLRSMEKFKENLICYLDETFTSVKSSGLNTIKSNITPGLY